MKNIEEESINIIPKLPYKISKDIAAIDPENEEEESLVQSLKNYFEKNLYIWDTWNAKDFKFSLPDTVFSEEKKINFVNFEESDVNYDDSYISRNLTAEQLNEIWTKGKFSVKSKDGKVPYIWLLSQWLLKGRENIRDSFYGDWSAAFYFIYTIKNRFSLDRNYSSFNFPHSFLFLIKSVRELWGLFFGRVRYKMSYMDALEYPETYIDPELFVEYQKNLLKDNPEIITSIYLPQFQTIIRNASNKFLEKWNEDSIQVEHELRESQLTPKEIIDKKSEVKFNRLIAELEKENKIDQRRMKYYIDLLKAERIYYKIKTRRNEKISALTKKVEEEIKSEHPIKSLVNQWYDKEIARRKAPEMEKIENETEDDLDRELENFCIQRSLIKSFRNYQKYLPQNRRLYLSQKKYSYADCSTTIMDHFPPYEIEKMQDTYDEVPTYSLKKYTRIKTHPDCLYWRLKLLLIRVLVSWRNCLALCYHQGWNSSFGLKAFCAYELVRDYSVNCLTGQIEHEVKTFSYWSSLDYLSKSIAKSRTDFARAGDNGFLNGKTGQVINWIENYILKLIFGGIAIGLIYPALILVCTLLSAVICLLGVVFFTLVFPLGYLFCILIYDFDAPYARNSCGLIPLIVIVVWRILIQCIMNFISAIGAIISQMALSLFMLPFGVFRWTFRSLYDVITYGVIRCNGSIPKADTSFAWKISGPGANRILFYKLGIEEALLLVRATLEQNQLEAFRSRTSERISSPEKIHTSFNERILKNLNASIITNPSLNESVQKYLNILNKQIEERMKIYPKVPGNVRFGKEELEVLLEATYDLIKDFVGQTSLDYIWKKNKLVKNDWRLLTERILISTFGTEEILIDVDDSEIRNDQKFNVNTEVVKLSQTLGFEKRLRKAHMKQSAFLNFTSGKMDDYNEEDYYHKMDSKNARRRPFQLNFDDIPDSDIYVNNIEHFRISVSEEVIGKQRFESEQAKDNALNN